MIYEARRTRDSVLDDALFVGLVSVGGVLAGLRLLWTGARRWDALDYPVRNE